jgi:Histidine kinase
MNGSAALPPAIRLRPWRWLVDSLREWSWRHTAISLLVGALALFNLGGAFFFPENFAYGRNLTYNICEFGLPYVLALRLADRAIADGVPRALAYSVAVVTVIAVGVWVIGPLLLPIIGGEADWTAADDTALAFGLVLPFSIGTVAYAAWRRERDTQARLQAAEVSRAHQEQQLQSARLLALQARVEPQFLFDTLARVREGIEPAAAESAVAERRLSDLIALLRAMQPVAGATASTLGREFELVQAYARASEAAALQAPRLVLQAEGAALQARFAPLVLLPALRALIGDAPRAGWRVQAVIANDRLHLTISPRSLDTGALTALHGLDSRVFAERLIAVHGNSSVLAIGGGDAPGLQIDVPCEATTDTRATTDESTRPDR